MAFGGRSFPDAEQEVPEQEGPSELETDAELFIVAQLISRRLRRLPPSVEPINENVKKKKMFLPTNRKGINSKCTRVRVPGYVGLCLKIQPGSKQINRWDPKYLCKVRSKC